MCEKDKNIIAQLESKLRTSQQHVQELQHSYNSMASSADFYRGMNNRQTPLASQGGMMAALLEMLWNRSQPNLVDSRATTVLHHSTTDTQPHTVLDSSSRSRSEHMVVDNSALDQKQHDVSNNDAADRSQHAALHDSLGPVQQLEMFIQELETLRYVTCLRRVHGPAVIATLPSA